MSYIKKRIKAFGYAFSGIGSAFTQEAHLKIHLAATVTVICAGFYFSILPVEWCILILCCALVISLEMVNSAIENTCNLVTTSHNPKIKYIKDVAAGAVLVASLASLIIAVIIFKPYLMALFS